ncbi:60S ribosomal protein L12 [Sciurus carolinensis]|uniref:Large ribosomal subunit protein uL11 n=1 Tax=Sciurus carolinensis TaxID=30640 RepID=A0AA41T4Y8_SCICA|nr:60S ribosomal protein L12 [Sciurus carolinensis]
MPPKFNSNEIKVKYLRCTSGKFGASSALAPKISPLGLSPKKMPHRSLARELSGTIKEILGTTQSMGYNVNGCHPYDIIDDINSGAVECPTS